MKTKLLPEQQQTKRPNRRKTKLKAVSYPPKVQSAQKWIAHTHQNCKPHQKKFFANFNISPSKLVNIAWFSIAFHTDDNTSTPIFVLSWIFAPKATCCSQDDTERCAVVRLALVLVRLKRNPYPQFNSHLAVLLNDILEDHSCLDHTRQHSKHIDMTSRSTFLLLSNGQDSFVRDYLDRFAKVG